MPAKQPCDRYTPHLFLSNNRCRDCGFPESEHLSFTSPTGRGRAPTIEEKVQELVNSNCTHYTPHAWIVDRCRDCGRRETDHLTSSGIVIEEAAPTPVKKSVKAGIIRNEQDIAAALGVEGGRRNSGITISASSLQIRGKGTASAFPSTGLNSAHRVMDQAVAQMVLMDQELEEAKSQEFASLNSNNITQEQYDAKMKEINEAFALKEAELKSEVERAKKQIQEQEELLRAEPQNAQQDTAHNEELERIRQEAELARAEAAELRAQAAAAAEQAIAARDQAVQTEAQRQAEIEAARAEVQAVRLEAESLRVAAAEAAVAAAAAAAAATQREADRIQQQQQQQQQPQEKPAEEEKEEAPTVGAAISPVVVAPPSVTQVTPASAATAAAFNTTADDDEEESQPTATSPINAGSGPYAGTVNLNDVLLKVEKLFLTGKNYFRFCYSRSTVIVTALFLRVIKDEYVLCWSKGNGRNVHQTRTLPFSAIRSIIIGKQSSIFQRSEFSAALNNQCFSIIGEDHALHLMAANERDAEMTAFGLASLMKESRLTVNVFDFNQYREPEDAVLQQTQQEHTEDDDGAIIGDLTEYETLNTAPSAPRFGLQLQVRCMNLPLQSYNTIVCLVDREEKTDRLVYVSQTEKISSKNNNPEFQKTFEIEYERGTYKQLRFNVYDVKANSTQIEDNDRVGSIRLDVMELVEFDGIEFIYLLNHKDHSKNYKLVSNRSLIGIKCIQKRLLMKRNSITNGISAAAVNDRVQLKQLQQLLINGDIFTSYTENQPSFPLTLFYRITPNTEYTTQAAAEGAFVLGNLHYTIHNDSGDTTIKKGKDGKNSNTISVAKTEILPIRTICDVYVGKKHRSFSNNARDECCLSLLSKTGIRLDLEAKNKQQRDEFVSAITGILKYAANEARKKAQAKLGAV